MPDIHCVAGNSDEFEYLPLANPDGSTLNYYFLPAAASGRQRIKISDDEMTNPVDRHNSQWRDSILQYNRPGDKKVI